MVELEEFKYGGTNISAYRLVDPELEDVQNVVQDWVLGELRYGRKIPFQGKTIKVRLWTILEGDYNIFYLKISRLRKLIIVYIIYFWYRQVKEYLVETIFLYLSTTVEKEKLYMTSVFEVTSLVVSAFSIKAT